MHTTHCGVKRGGELPSGVPSKGCQALCPWGDCSDLAGSGRSMGSTGILRQSHKQPQSRAASSSGLSQSPGPPACGDPVPDKQIPEGFGYLWSLHRLHHGIKLHWACRTLLFGILRPFWADPSPSLPGDVLACSAARANRAALSRLPHLALFSHP